MIAAPGQRDAGGGGIRHRYGANILASVQPRQRLGHDREARTGRDDLDQLPFIEIGQPEQRLVGEIGQLDRTEVGEGVVSGHHDDGELLIQRDHVQPGDIDRQPHQRQISQCVVQHADLLGHRHDHRCDRFGGVPFGPHPQPLGRSDPGHEREGQRCLGHASQRSGALARYPQSMSSTRSPQSMKPATAAKKLGVLLTATPEEFQQRDVTRDELRELEANPPQWLTTLRADGPHPRPVVAHKLGVSTSGLARAGITDPLTSADIKALLENQPEWLRTERATQAAVHAENARVKARNAERRAQREG